MNRRVNRRNPTTRHPGVSKWLINGSKGLRQKGQLGHKGDIKATMGTFSNRVINVLNVPGSDSKIDHEILHKSDRAYRRALLVEASYEDIKSPYDGDYTIAHPNAVSGSLDALEAKFGIPVIYASQYKPLAEEKAASWLSKHFTYWYLEKNGFGRVLQEGDL